MSLTFNPFGLSFFDYKGGKNRMSTSTYKIFSGYDASIGQGDAVAIGNGGGFISANQDAAPTPPAMAGAIGTIVGQFVSVSWISATGVAMNNQPYWPAGTLTLNGEPAIATVADLFSNVYRVQCNATFSYDPTFQNFNLSGNASPNARTSQSTDYLNVSSYVASPNYWLDLKIVGLAPASLTAGANAWSDPYPEALVIINSHAFKPGTNGL